MEEVSKGYETFIAGKKINDDNGRTFEKVLKKATKPIKKIFNVTPCVLATYMPS